MSDKIIDRIRKLLKLAGNAGSEAEAALAAERAAQMMAQHEIHEAQVALDAPNEPRTPEPIEKRFEVTTTTKRVAWHMRVTGGVAKTYGACAYWHGGSVVLFGRLSAVQAASYTALYLMREIERITDRTAPTSEYSRAYRNAFRLGCARRVSQRLEEEHAQKRKAQGLPFDADDLPVGDPGDLEGDEVTPVDAEPPPASAGVLMKIERDHKEVEDAYADYSKKWRKGHHVGQVSSGSGYSAGRNAGDRVSLGGGGRGALTRGQGVLK